MQAVRAIVIKDNQLLVMHRKKFGHEYYTLIGGGVDIGEAPEQAVRRELAEEASLQVGELTHVFTERADDPYGIQYIFRAEYIGGDPTLNAASEEAKISALGQNTYEPKWLPLAALSNTNLVSSSVRDAILEGLKNGWPKEPKMLVWKYTPVSS